MQNADSASAVKHLRHVSARFRNQAFSLRMCKSARRREAKRERVGLERESVRRIQQRVTEAKESERVRRNETDVVHENLG